MTPRTEATRMEENFHAEMREQMRELASKIEKISDTMNEVKEYVARKDEQIMAMNSRLKETEETMKAYNWKLIGVLISAVIAFGAWILNKLGMR